MAKRKNTPTRSGSQLALTIALAASDEMQVQFFLERLFEIYVDTSADADDRLRDRWADFLLLTCGAAHEADEAAAARIATYAEMQFGERMRENVLDAIARAIAACVPPRRLQSGCKAFARAHDEGDEDEALRAADRLLGALVR